MAQLYKVQYSFVCTQHVICFSCDIPLGDLKVLPYFICTYTMFFSCFVFSWIFVAAFMNKKKISKFKWLHLANTVIFWLEGKSVSSSAAGRELSC